MALGVVGEGRAARVHLHRLLVGAALEGDAAGRGADAVGEAVHRVLEFAVGAEGEAATETVGRAAGRVLEGGSDDQISSGWSGPHSCQALSTAAALDQGQDMYAETPSAGPGGCVKRSSVTTPKLPLPAPRRAQKRSLFSVALAVSCLPSAVISVAPVRLSQVRPYARETTPWPPPRVRPGDADASGRSRPGSVTPFAAERAVDVDELGARADAGLARRWPGLGELETSMIRRPSPRGPARVASGRRCGSRRGCRGPGRRRACVRMSSAWAT